MRDFINCNFAKQRTEPFPRLGFVGEDIVERSVEMAIEDRSHQFGDEGRRIQQKSR